MSHLVRFFGLVVMLAGPVAAQEKKEVPKDLVPFQGTWKVVKADFGGKAPQGSKIPDLHFTFTGERVNVREGSREGENGWFSVNAGKGPAHFNMVNEQGTKVQGIYKFDTDGRLNVCLTREKNQRPKSFDTKNTSAGMMVLEKVKD